MVMTLPQMATTKPAPAHKRASRTGRTWPTGGARAPAGSAEKLYCVLATQIGRWAVAQALEILKLAARGIVQGDCAGAVDALGHRVELLAQRHVVRVEKPHIAARTVELVEHGATKRLGAGAAVCPVRSDDGLRAARAGHIRYGGKFRLGIGCKAV